METAQSLGLRYSLDARLKHLLHEVEAAHMAVRRRVETQMDALRVEWSTAHEQLQSAQRHLDDTVRTLRAEHAERVRRQQKVHTQTVQRAVREAEVELRAQYKEKEAHFEKVHKHNAAQLKSMEDQIRAQVSAGAVAEARRQRAAEAALVARVQELEAQGRQLVEAKQAEADEARGAAHALESKLRDSERAAREWRTRWQRGESERRAAAEAAVRDRADAAAARLAAQEAQQQLVRAHESAAHAAREWNEERLNLTRQVAEAQGAVEAARGDMERAVERARAQQRDAETTHQSARAKHAHELDTIQQRVRGVLQGKDEQIRSLQMQLQVQTQKVMDIERDPAGV